MKNQIQYREQDIIIINLKIMLESVMIAIKFLHGILYFLLFIFFSNIKAYSKF